MSIKFISRPRDPPISQLAFRELTERHGEALTTFRFGFILLLLLLLLLVIVGSRPSSLVNTVLKNRQIIQTRQPQTTD